jgi:hypothetical protein
MMTDPYKGISPSLRNKVKTTLLRCGPFSSNEDLRRLFNESRIKTWASGLPDAHSPEGRVNASIEYLHMRRNKSGENALVLFLRVLSDNTHGDCPQVLAKLASQLEAEVGGPRPIFLPVVAVTMRHDEAESLLLSDKLDQDFRNVSVDLKTLKTRYGKDSRDEWMPFGKERGNIQEILRNFAEQNPISDNGRIFKIVFNFHSDVFFSIDSSVKRGVLRNLRERGCLFLVDGISLLNDKIRQRFSQGLMGIERQLVVFVMSPINPKEDSLNKRLADMISNFYPMFLEDYEVYLSPHRGLCIGDQIELMRYLKMSLKELRLTGQIMEPWKDWYGGQNICGYGMSEAITP